MSWPARLAIAVVRGYQLLIRPLLPPACRFEPSCSEYCCRALAGHGVVHGGALAVRRIARCHPWHPGGYDPPPLPGPSSEERPGA